MKRTAIYLTILLVSIFMLIPGVNAQEIVGDWGGEYDSIEKFGDSYEMYDDIVPPNSYVIGTHIFTSDMALTMPRIMLAATTIGSAYYDGKARLDDMVIYYKDPWGDWQDALTGEELDFWDVPSYIEYENLVRFSDKEGHLDFDVETYIYNLHLNENKNENTMNLVGNIEMYSDDERILEYDDLFYEIYYSEDSDRYFEYFTSIPSIGEIQTDMYAFSNYYSLIDLEIEDAYDRPYYYKVRICGNVVESSDPEEESTYSCTDFSKSNQNSVDVNIKSAEVFFDRHMIEKGIVFTKVTGDFSAIEDFNYDTYWNGYDNTILKFELDENSIVDTSLYARKGEARSSSKYKLYFDGTSETEIENHVVASNVDLTKIVPEITVDYSWENFETEEIYYDISYENLFDEEDELNYEFVAIYKKIANNDYDLIEVVCYGYDLYRSLKLNEGDTIVARAITVNPDNTITYSDYSDEIVMPAPEEDY